jgi:hypothetical protein
MVAARILDAVLAVCKTIPNTKVGGGKGRSCMSSCCAAQVQVCGDGEEGMGNTVDRLIALLVSGNQSEH